MKNFGLALLGGALVLVVGVAPALAHAPFKKAFEDRYVKNGSEALKASFEKAGCNVCHVKDEKKDVRNGYGQALHKALMDGDLKGVLKASDEKEFSEKLKELVKSDKEVALKNFDDAVGKVEKAAGPGGKTWGDLFKGGMLP